MHYDPLGMWAHKWNVPVAAIKELATIFYDATAISGAAGSESRVQSEIQLEAPRIGCAMWRNNSGATTDDTGRLVRYGLGHISKDLNKVWKSSDLIGITPVTWCGRTFGVFTAVEVKESGWKGPKNDHERAQGAFHATVESLGGIGMFAASKEQYMARVS